MPIDIWSILRSRYPENQYALMKEVSDAAGFNRSNSADYIAVSLWPSRGLGIYGIELKSFRSDWLNELKKPAKAENIFQYCDYFYLLTSDETIAKLEEIPPTWGWLCIKGSRIFTKKEAPKLNPKPVSKNFIAAMLKRACDRSQFVHKDSIQDEIKRSYEQGKNENERNYNYLKKEIQELKLAISEFETASGIQFRGYRTIEHAKEIGSAVKFINDGGAKLIHDQLITLEKNSKDIYERISQEIETMKKL